VDASAAIKLARLRARLSKRELARRASTSPAAIVHYESGVHSPTLPTLERIVAAAGSQLKVDVKALPIPREVSNHRVQQVLELAEHLPKRPAARVLTYPRLPR
jgi:transcriptional regulator with XRE-family HTH domain